jgi:hypothetical protein
MNDARHSYAMHDDRIDADVEGGMAAAGRPA